MKIVVDTHIHSVSSGHAYSTIQEMTASARDRGVKIVALTDHGPAMEGAPSVHHFSNLRVLPGVINKVRVIKGIEANIVDYQGDIDLPIKYLKRVEFVIASLHDIVIQPSSVKENTNALVNVLKNPYIDVIGHPGNPIFEVDIEKVVFTAKEYDKLIEINNSSFKVRKGSEKNCRTFLEKCKDYGVKVICGSDAHISFDVGEFGKVEDLLDEVGMPKELVLSATPDKFMKYIKERKHRINNAQE